MTPAAEKRGDRSKPGYRFGPFIIVPELRTGKDDPWAHRKGEPRVLVLLWAMYLMGAALMTIFAVRSLGAPAAGRYEYGCRAMVILVVCGLGVLWPMVRLSQVPPAHPVRAMLVDLCAMLAPVQAVVWPMPLLTTWTLPVAGGLNLMIASWALLAGVLLAFGSASRSMATRTLLMLVAVAFVGAAPGLALYLGSAGSPPMPGWWEMLSPITATLALTAAPGNQTPQMTGLDWVWAAAPMVVALVALVLLRPTPVGARDPEPNPTEANGPHSDEPATRWSERGEG